MSDVILVETPAGIGSSPATERAAMRLATRRIPRIAAYDLQTSEQVLAKANALWQQTQEEAEQIKLQSKLLGFQAGKIEAALAATDVLLEAQRQAKAFVDASEPRVVDLVFAVLHHMLPRLPRCDVIDSLVQVALQSVQAQNCVRVYVHPDVEPDAKKLSKGWRQLFPGIQQVEVETDSTLGITDCRVASSLGSVTVGLQQQFNTIVKAYDQSRKRGLQGE